MKSALGVTTDGELAEALQISRSAVVSWRNRNSVPYVFCIQIATRERVSLDWLLLGRTSKTEHASVPTLDKSIAEIVVDNAVHLFRGGDDVDDFRLSIRMALLDYLRCIDLMEAALKAKKASRSQVIAALKKSFDPATQRQDWQRWLELAAQPKGHKRKGSQ